MTPNHFALNRWGKLLVLCAAMRPALAGGAEPALVRAEGRIVDAESGKALAARVYLRGEDGSWHFPRSASQEGTAIEYRREASPVSLEMHTTLSAHPFVADLAPGKYALHVERGKEYLSVDRSFTVDEAPVSLTIELHRWIDMAKLGWYSGDTHVHRGLDECRNLVLAEDLNIAFPLSHWVTEANVSPLEANRVKSEERMAAPIEVDATHLLYPLNTEYELFTVDGKPHTQGAVVIIGHKEPFDLGAPPVGEIARRAHEQGALLDLEKHSWPWSAAIVPVMQVDLFELANNHVWQTEFGYPDWTLPMAGEYMQLERNAQGGFTEWGWIDFGFQTYYALLNCGLRLSPTAGTAAGVHPVPLGFGRVYVKTRRKFSYEDWLAGLKAGRSFVTTGPMLVVTVNGRDSGETLQAEAAGERFRVRGTVDSVNPLVRIEIILDGQVVETVKVSNERRPVGGWHNSIEAAITPKRSGWIAVRAFEKLANGRLRFAHTAPFHFEMKGKPLRPRLEELAYLIGRVEEELARNRGVLSEEALDEYRQALAFYRGLAGEEAAPKDPQSDE